MSIVLRCKDACESLTLWYVIVLREAFVEASTFRASELDTASFHAIIILLRGLPIDSQNRQLDKTRFLFNMERIGFILPKIWMITICVSIDQLAIN